MRIGLGCVWVPEWRAVVFIDNEFAIGAVRVLEAAESELASGVIARTAGKLGSGVLFARALCAAIDVKPDDGIARVDELLRKMKRVEGVGVGSVAKLPDDGGNLIVGDVGRGDEGEGVVGLVEEFENRRWDDRAGGVVRGLLLWSWC